MQPRSGRHINTHLNTDGSGLLHRWQQQRERTESLLTTAQRLREDGARILEAVRRTRLEIRDSDAAPPPRAEGVIRSRRAWRSIILEPCH
jgi:hypothetical protein